MATVITHALAAAALSTIAPKVLPRIRLGLVLGVLAVIPDLDVIGFRFGIPYEDVLGHRGFTHSITMRHPDQDVEALMREVLEEGENPENFNWIVRQIVESGKLGIWQ